MEKNKKKCPKCMTEIDKDATFCPNCKNDLRNWFVRHWIISILLFIFIVLPFIAGLSEGIPSSNNITGDITNNNTTTNNSISNKDALKNDTGIWKKVFYVDDFGDKTKDSYITTKSVINGNFSNTATQDSRLKVEFLINNKNDINIMLYEYASNNPVKAISNESYNVFVKDKNGNKIILHANSNSDRLKIRESLKLHNILLDGGKIKFIIKKIDFPSEYNFVIDNADGYNKLF